MFISRPYLPEGMNQSYQENAKKAALFCDSRHIDPSLPLEVVIERCDRQHDLHATLGGRSAVIRRGEAMSPDVSGAEKEISVLSLVGRSVCCRLCEPFPESSAAPLFLSRRSMQEEALTYLLSTLNEGDVLPAVITSLSPIGAFADIGCGVIALLPLRQISVSRITHPNRRFSPHQQIFAAVQKIDRTHKRFLLTHRELLGTWRENAACFQVGETVVGIVRGIKSYGVFIELAPNLTGLAETDLPLCEDQRVCVLIKAIHEERRKIKLHVVGTLPPAAEKPPLHYFRESGTINGWSYET